MPRQYLDYITDILDSVIKIHKFIENMTFETFKTDDKTVYAVIRAMEIIGEAVKHIPDDVRSENSSIPWKSMAGMRDVLIHDYFGVDLETIWATAKEKIPPLEVILRKMLEG